MSKIPPPPPVVVIPPPPVSVSLLPPKPSALTGELLSRTEAVKSGMLTLDMFHDYQNRTVTHLVNNDDAMLWLGLGLGKQLPMYSKILTPDGWVENGSMKVGQKLVHPKGGYSTVTGVYPQGIDKVYEIELCDGRIAECGKDHLWEVNVPSVVGSRSDGSRWSVVTKTLSTEELLSRKYKSYSLQRIERLDLPEKDLPLEPYLLGALLGDGCLRGDVALSYHVDDVFIKDKCQRLLPEDSHISGDRFTSENGKQCRIVGIATMLNELGLYGTYSNQRFIPTEYMYASFNQRLELLRGLMDTDGSIRERNRKSFDTTSEELCNDICELILSLGGNFTTSNRLREREGVNCSREYKVHPSFIDINPFSLPRKADMVTEYKRDRVSSRIKDIRETGKYVEQQCIKIDNPDGLYIIDDYVVTHNTVTTLTAFAALKSQSKANKMLVVAPLRVCELQWEQECEKWTHLNSTLKFSKMIGTAKKRQAALFSEADVYLVNYESLPWLTQQLEHYFINQGLTLPFDGIVFDEISKMKNHKSVRFKEFKSLIPHFSRRWGLTASPASNGLHNLWGQFKCIDNGERLGGSPDTFIEAHFGANSNADGYTVYNPLTSKGEGDSYMPSTKEMIVNKVKDVTIEIPAEGNLNMPEFSVQDILVTLPPRKYSQYSKLERELIVDLDNGTTIEPFNSAALMSKLLQFSNGIVYNYPDDSQPEYREQEKIHEEKYKALDDLITESGDEPIFLAYNFTSEKEELMRRYPKARCMTGVTEEEAVEIQSLFNSGKLKLLIAHPMSAGHGLNLQHACSIVVWFGLNYNLELYEQFIGRIYRQGQTKPVRCLRILSRDTIDMDVSSALRAKDKVQQELKDAMRGVEGGASMLDQLEDFDTLGSILESYKSRVK